MFLANFKEIFLHSKEDLRQSGYGSFWYKIREGKFEILDTETIFSQCNTFISMRLTNPDDQNYVKKLLPDTLGNLTSKLNSLSAGEALLIGESVIMPSVVRIDRCNPEPSSNDIMYFDVWKEQWHDDDFNEIIAQWEK